jgi:hypothetical protein
LIQINAAMHYQRSQSDLLSSCANRVTVARFIAYMSWRLTIHWSDWLLGFALFDLLTLTLVLNEWRSGNGKPALNPDQDAPDLEIRG